MQFFNKFKKQGSFGFASCKDMATAIVESVPKDAFETTIDKIELSKIGKGPDEKSGFFLNIFLKDNYVHERIAHINNRKTIELEDKPSAQGGEESKEEKPPKVLVDFSSPNIAKNMHVGHLRSTIQGDSICRIFEFLGYEVMRVNHVGDWGTQFGMLIQELNENFPDFLENTPAISDLQSFYQNAKKRFDEDEEFKKKAHDNVVKLQSGDEACLAGWKMLCQLSRNEFQKLYDRLDVKLEECGESFYNPFLPGIVSELKEKGVAVEDQGAICIFVGKKKAPPMIIQKSDGGFGYASTDIAAIRYRAQELKCDRIVVVTDVGQEFHFKQLFEAGPKCGYVDPKVTKLDHMMFGMVLQEVVTVDENGKEVKKQEKIKTRAGKSVKLVELLDEAKERQLQMFKDRMASGEPEEDGEDKEPKEQKKVQLDEKELEEAAEVLGISSIKYFDLRQNRVQNYVFNYDHMLDPKGNTGVYLIYAYVRICSILRKAGFDDAKADDYKFVISNKAERDLALTILRLPEAVEDAAKNLAVNRLTDQLYEISSRVSDFYHASRVLGSDEQDSRVGLLIATKKIMEVCFSLLGMKTITRI
mmetsp:Transcript_11515/g.17358  ORF Transcript_11515/g.17358 Transcript_11515/m.17358 type:complete len:587 (-) Transcript_11515:29-1789(-)